MVGYALTTQGYFIWLPDQKNKAIYSLHQIGREWFYEIDGYLKIVNFKKLDWCNCTYVYENNAVLLLYVNDIIILRRNHKLGSYDP